MKILEGKTKEEKTKIVIAAVLGTLALLALVNLFFAPFSGSKKSVTVNVSPTPGATASPSRTGDRVVAPLPRQNEIDDIYTRVPVVVQYPPGAPEPGRNIFAFYEPPIPTPFSPTPTPIPKTPTPPTPVPVPTPNVVVSLISKQSIYEGEKGFRLEVAGDKFTPETQIWFGGTPLPTNYVSPQQLWAEVPSNYLVGAGVRNVEVKSADGRLFSNAVAFNIQAPPRPQFQYLGIVARKRGNNDTAFVMEQGKTLPTSYRLNDMIGGRFRLVSISPARLLVQDIYLGFVPPHAVELVKAPGAGGATTGAPTPAIPGGFNNRSNPNPQMVPNPQVMPCPPGIPCDNLRPYQTPPPKDVDDNDDDGDGDN